MCSDFKVLLFIQRCIIVNICCIQLIYYSYACNWYLCSITCMYCHLLFIVGFLLSTVWASSIAVRALVYYAEDHGSGPTSSQWLDARSLSTQQRVETWWKHWGDKSSDERKCPPYLTSGWPRTKVLSKLPQRTGRIWDLPLPFTIYSVPHPSSLEDQTQQKTNGNARSKCSFHFN